LAEPAPAAPDLPAGAGAAEPLPGAPVTEIRPPAHAPAAPGGKTVPGAAPASSAGDAAPAVAEPVAPTPDAAASAPAPKATADGEGLVLHVHAPSWVEVVQANGTSVFSQICPAGSVQVIHGEAPLRVVIGNAASVDAQYHGAVVDLNRYANVNGVARLTLQ
jgi:cytoskeleton protein RodZ